MPRKPQTQAEYLARLLPPSATPFGSTPHGSTPHGSTPHGSAPFARRSLLQGALGAASLVALTACGDGGGGGSASTTVTLGSNASDEVPKATTRAVTDGFTTAEGVTVTTNTVDHNTFQENINTYLQGKPDDVFTWFAGYRMRFFAQQGLAGDVSDVWSGLSGYTDGFKAASTGDDGKQYFVPASYYPWAVFYRKSVWEKHGYQVPVTLDDLTALAAQMKKDGLVPLAFADKDGWPAMGTFDILNMRINGYQFHVDLMAGTKAWNSPEVTKVFDTWTSLLPYHQTDALGRTWQEAAQTLQQGKAGMYLLGLFVSEQFPEADHDDLDFFTFPEVDSVIGADALDAPIDGYMMAAEPREEKNAKALLSWFGSKAAADIMVEQAPTTLIANSDGDVSGYTPLQKKAAEIVGSAGSIAQFLDRDTRPDFASTVMIPALQDYLKDPGRIGDILGSVEAQKKSIFGS